VSAPAEYRRVPAAATTEHDIGAHKTM